MSAKPWDPSRHYVVGDVAIVKGVECEVISESTTIKFDGMCALCPIYPSVHGIKPTKLPLAPNGCAGCKESLSPSTIWAGRDALLLARLKGQA